MDTNFYEQYSPYSSNRARERGPDDYLPYQDRRKARLPTPGISPPVNWQELSKLERMREIKAEEEQFRREDLDRYDIDASRATNTWRNRGMRGYDIYPFAEWWRPRCDILEDSKHVRLEFEIPGVPASEITVRITNDTLILSSLKAMTNKEESMYIMQNERHFGHFFRKIVLPEYVDTSKNVGAVLENGVLKITLDKIGVEKAVEQGRKIEIKGENLFIPPKHQIMKEHKEIPREAEKEQPKSVQSS